MGIVPIIPRKTDDEITHVEIYGCFLDSADDPFGGWEIDDLLPMAIHVGGGKAVITNFDFRRPEKPN